MAERASVAKVFAASPEELKNPELLRKRAEASRDLAIAIKQENISAEELTSMFEIRRLVTSSDPVLLRRGIGALQTMMTDAAKRGGLDVPGVDLLDDFPELKQQVEQMALTRDVALELARARRTIAENERRSRASTESAQAQAVRQAAEDSARRALNELGETLNKSDIDFPAKLKLLEDHGELRDIMALPPEQWVTAFKRRYDLLTAAQPARSVRPNGAARPQPASRVAAAGGGAPTPKTDLEAVEQALRRASGGA